jgi:steroid delta-isomerase-like uncharacterized protein
LGDSGEPVRGTAQLKQFRAAFLAAFPDLNIHVEDVLVDGDKTAVRMRFTGTHSGDGLGVPATGRRVVSSAIVILRWRDGRIIEAFNEFDAAGMMRQLQAPAAKLRP